LRKKYKFEVLLDLALILLISAIIFQWWLVAGIILPILIIFFFSLTPEEIDLKNVVINKIKENVFLS